MTLFWRPSHPIRTISAFPGTSKTAQALHRHGFNEAGIAMAIGRRCRRDHLLRRMTVGNLSKSDRGRIG